MVRSVFTPSYARLRRLLVTARESQGLTQHDLAKRLRKPQSFVSKYERGERRIDVVEFLHIADAIGVDACELLAELARGNGG